MKMLRRARATLSLLFQPAIKTSPCSSVPVEKSTLQFFLRSWISFSTLARRTARIVNFLGSNIYPSTISRCCIYEFAAQHPLFERARRGHVQTSCCCTAVTRACDTHSPGRRLAKNTHTSPFKYNER